MGRGCAKRILRSGRTTLGTGLARTGTNTGKEKTCDGAPVYTASGWKYAEVVDEEQEPEGALVLGGRDKAPVVPLGVRLID